VLNPLKSFSEQRLSWGLLLIAVIFFELCALFFQHVMNLAPCVMCIYERVAMLGIGGASIIGLINPRSKLFRYLGLIAWFAASIQGYLLASKHVDYQLNPSPFATCDIFVNFPSWAPLNVWLPQMFEAYGDCSEIVWQWLGWSMPQWLVFIFVANAVVALIFIALQLFPTPSRQ
jgi:disulfide bond formation protein DsbB